jgi:purine-binding chemotaxis protein CheW
MPETEPMSREEGMQLVTLMLGAEEYGLPITDVQEVMRFRTVRVTEIPNAPAFTLGVMNLRGRVVPVVDMHERFQLPEVSLEREARVVIVGVEGRTVGLIVDAVVEVVRVDPDDLEPLPDLAGGVNADYVRGIVRVDDRMVIVLDIERVFSAEESRTLAGMAGDEGEASR